MLKARDLRALDEEELEEKYRELKEELFNLRFQHATGQLDNPMRIKETRRDIARVCTVMTERQYSIHVEAFEEALSAPPRREALEEPEELVEAETDEEIEEELQEEALVEQPVESEEQLEEEVEEELRDL